MARKLIVMNGRGDYGYSGFDGHFYVCAESKAEAVRMLKQIGYTTMTIGELNTYWAKGAWGYRMDALVPVREKGVWFVPREFEHDNGFTPRRLL